LLTTTIKKSAMTVAALGALGLGGAAIAVLAVLLLLETRSGRAASSLLALAALIVLVVIVVVVALSSDAGGIATGVLSFLLYLVVLLLYAPLLMARSGARNGQTLGKQMLGIRVVRNTGQPMDFAWSALREVVVKGLLFGFVGGFFFSIPTLIDYLWPLWDDQNRALHDMVVTTHVVKG
jgi:uncharacterized RDD family membrane protein YckC